MLSVTELLATSPPATEDPGVEGPGGSFDSLSGGAVAGIVIGVLVLIILLGAVIFMTLRGQGPSPLASLMNRGQEDNSPITPDNVAPEQAGMEVEVEGKTKEGASRET